MLPTFIDEHAAFEFSQTVESVYRESERSLPVSEKITQNGFLLLESSIKPPSVLRILTQLTLSSATLANLRRVDRAKRYPLWEESNAQYRLPKKPFGLALPLQFTTDPSTGLSRMVGEGNVGIPYAAIHLPGVTPAVRLESPVAGAAWKSVVSVKCGFGVFVLPYTSTWSAVDNNFAIADSTFDPPLATESAPILKDVQLRFHPAGKWSTAYALRGGAPQSAKGALQYSVLAQTPGKQDAIETLNIKLTFEWKKILLSFDNEYLQTLVWANPPKL